MVDRTEQFFRRVTNAELDGKITVPNGGTSRGPTAWLAVTSRDRHSCARIAIDGRVRAGRAQPF